MPVLESPSRCVSQVGLDSAGKAKPSRISHRVTSIPRSLHSAGHSWTAQSTIAPRCGCAPRKFRESKHVTASLQRPGRRARHRQQARGMHILTEPLPRAAMQPAFCRCVLFILAPSSWRSAHEKCPQVPAATRKPEPPPPPSPSPPAREAQAADTSSSGGSNRLASHH